MSATTLTFAAEPGCPPLLVPVRSDLESFGGANVEGCRPAATVELAFLHVGSGCGRSRGCLGVSVTVLGAYVPVWTLDALAAGVAVSLQVWRPLARWMRWQPGATLASFLLFTVALALTLAPEGDRPAMGLDACIPYDWNDFLLNVLHTGGGIFGDVLNLLLLLPLTISLVLASGRVLPAVAVAVLLPTAIELVQTQLPGRSCAYRTC